MRIEIVTRFKFYFKHFHPHLYSEILLVKTERCGQVWTCRVSPILLLNELKSKADLV